MRIRRLSLVVVLLLMPTPARAHDHIADFFGGGSSAYDSTLWGFHTQLGTTLPWLENKDLSAVGDLALHIGTHDGADLTRVTFLGGFRYAPSGMRLFKNIVSFHALLGGVHDADADSSNEFALAIGGGYEYLPKGQNPGGGHWGFRVQADYVISSGDGFPRVSAGVVYRITPR
jgi:hypothetical protein